MNTTGVLRLARSTGVRFYLDGQGKFRAAPKERLTPALRRGIRENLDELRRRALFLCAVKYLRARGGRAATDALTDTESEELDRVWLDEDIPTFAAYLIRRCKEALEAVREAA